MSLYKEKSINLEALSIVCCKFCMAFINGLFNGSQLGSAWKAPDYSINTTIHYFFKLNSFTTSQNRGYEIARLQFGMLFTNFKDEDD